MALLAKNDFDRVKDEAAGHWQAVIGRMYPDLAQVLQRPGDARCACPVHGTGTEYLQTFIAMDNYLVLNHSPFN